MKPKLTEKDWESAAKALGCEVKSIKAVAAVEAPRGGFQSDDKPVILFEAHVFGRLTKHVYDKSHPNISAPRWDKSLYGPTGVQHDRLQKAAALDREAAFMSASWGRFQIMGENWRALGYASVDDFVNKMYDSEAMQLDSFVRYIKANPKIWQAIKNKNWAGFALGYNGPGYKANKYDEKIAQAYQALT